MGYHLTYELQTMKIVPNRTRKKWHRYLLMLAVLLLGTLTVHICTAVLETVLLGEGKAAKEAAEQMVASIRRGSPLSEAVQTFCSEIIP